MNHRYQPKYNTEDQAWDVVDTAHNEEVIAKCSPGDRGMSLASAYVEILNREVA